MVRKEILRLARVLTLLVRQHGRPANYLQMVDLVDRLVRKSAAGWHALGSDTTSASGLQDGGSVSGSVLRRILMEIGRAAHVALDIGLVLQTLTSPRRTPQLASWPDGPPAGVYVTDNWKFAKAALARYSAATGGAIAYTDWALLAGPKARHLQPSQDDILPGVPPHESSPLGLSGADLLRKSPGALIVTGPWEFAEHPMFQTAAGLHEGCFLANEMHHRVVVVIRTPRPQSLWKDLERLLGDPQYFDPAYEAMALRGTVEPDGHLAVRPSAGGDPQGASDDAELNARVRSIASRPMPSAAGRTSHRGNGGKASTYGESVELSVPIVRPRHRHYLTRAGKAIPGLSPEGILMADTRAGQEAALALCAKSLNGSASPGQASDSFSLRLLEPPDHVPDDLALHLARAVSQRRTGLLLLGGRPGSVERELLFQAALSVTAPVGPVALVLPAYQLGDAERYVQIEESPEGTQRVYSRRFPQLPIYPSVASAIASGYSRIAIEYECEPYLPVPHELLRRHAREVCFIVGANDFDTRTLFTRIAPAQWDDWACLIGLFGWVRLQGTAGSLSLCDICVPGNQIVNTTRYRTTAAALTACRQRQWETQALKHLEAHRVEPLQLRQQLVDWDILDPHDHAAMRDTEQPEHVSRWLYERVIARAEMGTVARQMFH